MTEHEAKTELIADALKDAGFRVVGYGSSMIVTIGRFICKSEVETALDQAGFECCQFSVFRIGRSDIGVRAI